MVRQGNLNVLVQGTVICPIGSETEIDLVDNAKVKFIFADDTINAIQRIETKLIESTLEIKYYNFNNASGISTTNPMLLGQIGNKPILFNCAIYSIGETGKETKVVHYNFLEKVEGANV
jgi:hypothetical protein